MPILSRPLPNSQFSGFLDDELGKLANLNSETFQRIRLGDDRYRALQEEFNSVSLDTLNTYLLNVALFADPILTVDGWMILTPDWWSSFMEPELNLLPQMLKCGLVRSFTRYQGDLASLADREAAKGIVTYEQLIKSARTRETYPVLQRFLSRYDDLDVVRYVPWPKYDMDEVMIRVVDSQVLDELSPARLRALGINEQGFEQLRSKFCEETAPIPGTSRRRNSTRQGWMLSVLSLIDNDGFWYAGQPRIESIRSLAQLGVEAYHGSRACALNAEHPHLSVDVASLPQRVLTKFEDATDVSTPQLLEDGLISLTMSWKEFPKDKCATLRDLEDPTSVLGSRKLRFLASRDAHLDALARNADSRRSFSEYESAAKDYIRVLNDTFQTRVFVSTSGSGQRATAFLDSLSKSPAVSKVIAKTTAKAFVQFADQYLFGGSGGLELRTAAESLIEVYLQDRIGNLHFNSKKIKLVDYKRSIFERTVFRTQYISKVNSPLVAPSHISCEAARSLVEGVTIYERST